MIDNKVVFNYIIQHALCTTDDLELNLRQFLATLQSPKCVQPMRKLVYNSMITYLKSLDNRQKLFSYYFILGFIIFFPQLQYLKRPIEKGVIRLKNKILLENRRLINEKSL